MTSNFCYRCGNCKDDEEYSTISLEVYNEQTNNIDYDEFKTFCERCKINIMEIFQEQIEGEL